jgi:hypothetical protein
VRSLLTNITNNFISITKREKSKPGRIELPPISGMNRTGHQAWFGEIKIYRFLKPNRLNNQLLN